MDLNLAEIKQWLLQSIPGIIVLGALGSIVATILIHLARSSMKALMVRKDRIFMQLIYSYIKEIEIGEKFRDIHTPKSVETRYLATVVYETGMWVGLAVMLLVTITVTISIYLLFAIDRPVVLSIFVGMTLFLANATLKHGLYITSLLSQESLDIQEAIKKAQPKAFSAWDKKLDDVTQNMP